MPGDLDASVRVILPIDLNESLERVEKIMEEEMPRIHEQISALASEPITGPRYIGVTNTTENAVELTYEIICKGKEAYNTTLMLNRELRLVCEHHGITPPRSRVVVNQPEGK